MTRKQQSIAKIALDCAVDVMKRPIKDFRRNLAVAAKRVADAATKKRRPR